MHLDTLSCLILCTTQVNLQIASYEDSFIRLVSNVLFVHPSFNRAAGIGMSSMSARIGGIIAPLILIFGDYWQPLPLIVFGSVAVIAGLLVLFLPETKGRTLPETIEEGERFGK